MQCYGKAVRYSIWEERSLKALSESSFVFSKMILLWPLMILWILYLLVDVLQFVNAQVQTQEAASMAPCLCMIQCDNNSLCAMQWSMFHIQPWWKFTQISKHRIELFLSCRVADTASSSTWPVIGNKLDLGSILDIYTVSVWSQSYKERLSNWLWHVKFARELLWFTWKLTIFCVYWYIWKWVHIKWRQASITK